jgi:hypothetical protein
MSFFCIQRLERSSAVERFERLPILTIAHADDIDMPEQKCRNYCERKVPP